MKPKMYLTFFLLISTLFFGCSPKIYLTPHFPATETLQPHSTPSLSIAIGLPTETNTPYLATVPAGTPAIPTLGASDAYLLLREFLKNDPPCQLPCWGGVTPGISMASDAEKDFLKLSSISSSDFTYFGQSGDSWLIGTLYILYPLINTQVQVMPGYVAGLDNKIVINVGLSTQSLPPENSTGLVFGDKEYNALLSDYTLPEIFTTYGLPNLIYTRADINVGEPTARDFFIIRLLYLDLGIFISYTMPMEEKGEAFRFCPSESLIGLELIPEDVGENYEVFFRQLGVTEWATLDKTHHQPLEDALGMANQEFSQVIISAPETCFESPKEIWPRP